MKTIRDSLEADRYLFDFGHCTIAAGFAQVDTGQDAPYFGTWANPVKRMIVCYCEGDVIIQTAESDREFVDELRKIKTWNEEQGHGFGGIDPGFDGALKEAFVALGVGDLLH